MNKSTFTGLRRSERLWVMLLIVTFESRAAEAYIDPGTTGLLSQVMYVIFYAALAAFLCGIRYIKGFMLSITDHVLRLFGRRKVEILDHPVERFESHPDITSLPSMIMGSPHRK
ncbi:MAG TPA: hypothetical protein VFY83_02620 [Anaerolineales bacterium]|nr:hypothetical protein [Anaerolineales bacterium]